MFTTIKGRGLLSKIVASKIEKAIITKKISAGKKLPTEIELGKQFGVSRTAVREALRTLVAKGLISIQKGKGIYVCDLSSEIITDQLKMHLQLNGERDYILDIVNARQILEPVISAAAALKSKPSDLQKLNDDTEKLKNCKSGFKDMAKIDMQFHLDVAKASHNVILPLLLGPIHRLYNLIGPSVYATNKDAKGKAIEGHQKIFDGILKKDPSAANQAMMEHLKIAEEHAVKMLKKNVHL